MFGRFLLGLMFAAGASSSALADGRVVLSFGDDPPSLVAYEEECGFDAECWTDGIFCEDGMITVSMGRLYTDEMVRWMMNGAEGFVFGIHPMNDLYLSKIERADIDGTWSAEFTARGAGPLASDADEIVFDSTVRRTRISLDAENKAALTQFLAACPDE